MLTASTVTDTAVNPVDTITLDETGRHRRRIALKSDGNIEFLLDLPNARLLRHGEGLVLSDGRVIEIRAQAEALYEISTQHNQHLLTLAWQIGNRHLAAEVMIDKIRIRRDPVIKEMLEGLGATISEISAPFNPEGGAYGGAHQPHSHSGDVHADHQHE